MESIHAMSNSLLAVNMVFLRDLVHQAMQYYAIILVGMLNGIMSDAMPRKLAVRAMCHMNWGS